MITCPKCQQPVKTKSGFCPSCGSRYHLNPQKPKWLFLIIIGATLFLGVFITHGQIKEKTGAFSTITEFEKILEQKDAEAAVTLFESQLQSTFSTEETMEEFLDYVDSESEWNSIVKDWKKTAVRDQNNYESIESIYGDQLFSIEETGSFLGIYPTYEVMIHPFTLQVKSYVPNTIVTFNKKTKTLTNEEFQKIARFLPSNSVKEITFSVESKYSDIGDTISFSNLTEEPNTVYLELPTEVANITVYSDEPEAIVFINGESTKTKVQDIGEIGPLPTDGSISVHAEIDGRESYSEDVYTDGDFELYFQEEYTYVEMDDYNDYASDLPYPSMEELENLYDSFQKMGVEAINNRDYSLIAEYYHPDGVSGTESANYINYLDSKGITEQLLESEVVDFEVVDEGIHLYTFESFMIYYTDKPDAQKSFNTEYLLVLDEGKWKFFELLKTTEL